MAALYFFFSLDFLELDAIFSEVIFCFCLIALSCLEMSNFGFCDKAFWFAWRGSCVSVSELSNWLLATFWVVAGLIYLGRSYFTAGLFLSLLVKTGAKLSPTTFTGGTFKFFLWFPWSRDWLNFPISTKFWFYDCLDFYETSNGWFCEEPWRLTCKSRLLEPRSIFFLLLERSEYSSSNLEVSRSYNFSSSYLFLTSVEFPSSMVSPSLFMST